MVDVAQYNETDLPLAICDSRALAFADAQFDMALLSFVLHHSPNPEGILSEALRVAPRVVVVENHVKGRLRAAITRIVDSWPAIRYGTPPCYFTRNREAWLDFFRGFPVQTRPLGEFSGELGFFDCFTVELSRSSRCDGKL
jgi:SAM-dependent methyltransferase